MIQFTCQISLNSDYVSINDSDNIRTRYRQDNRRQLRISVPKKALIEKSKSFTLRTIWNNLPLAYHLANDRGELTRLLLENNILAES